MGVIGKYDDLEPVGKGLFTLPTVVFEKTEEEKVKTKKVTQRKGRVGYKP